MSCASRANNTRYNDYCQDICTGELGHPARGLAAQRFSGYNRMQDYSQLD
jgi:hypothetical protein